jgi:uncharacterized protein YbjT (DUF2867 family)
LANDEFALRPYIKKDSKIYSATDDFPLPFVAVKDIAEVAYHGLTDEKPVGECLYLNGPEALRYSEVYLNCAITTETKC